MSALTHDAFLGGRLHLWQPKQGYRAGVDPVLLAASVPIKQGQSLLDLGCGVGAAALCVGARCADVKLVGVERQPAYADLARRNGLDVATADLGDLPAALRQRAFDHVIANPPYFDRAASTSAQDPGREGALGEDTPLADWIAVAARRLKPKGYFHLIHRMDRLPDALAALEGRLGSVAVLPLSARAGRAPELMILRARKGGRAKFCLSAPVILHSSESHTQDGDDYSPLISKVLREGAPLWPLN